MGFKKSLERLLKEPTEMRLNEIRTIMEHYGYVLKRVKGSHFHFMNQSGYIFTLPVHNNVIAQRYLKKIINDIIKPHDKK